MATDLLTSYRRDLLQSYTAQAESLRRALGDRRSTMQESLEPGGWTPHQVIWHVRAVETQAYLPRLERLLARDGAELQDFDGDGWMATRYAADEPWQRIVDDFVAARQEMAARLDAAPVAAWSHTGRHGYWGSRTLMWWVERSLAHVDEHIGQLGHPPLSLRHPSADSPQALAEG
jgi:hypothetical protein